MGEDVCVCTSEFDYLLRLKQENEFLALLLRQFSIVEKGLSGTIYMGFALRLCVCVPSFSAYADM